MTEQVELHKVHVHYVD